MWQSQYGSLELCRAKAFTTTTQQPAVDLLTYADNARRQMKVVVSCGALTTIATATFAITQSTATNGTFSAPTYGTTQVVSTATAGNFFEMDVRADNRYIRLELTVDATGSVPVSAIAVALKEIN